MTDPKWHCWKGEIQSGPFSETQLRQMIRAGLILPTDRVRLEGWDTWVDASMIPLAETSDALHVAVPNAPAKSEEGDPISREHVRRLSRIAWYYRWVNRLAIPYFLIWLIAGFGGFSTEAAIRIQWPWLLVWPPVFFFYARSLGRWEAAICAAFGLIPCLNLAVLLGLNRVARGVCRSAGWNMGILGRYPQERKSAASTAWGVLMLIVLAAAVAWAISIMVPKFQSRPPATRVAPKLDLSSNTPTRFEIRRGQGTVFYWSKDLQSEVERLATAFEELELFQGEGGIDVELLASGDKRLVKMFLTQQGVSNPASHSAFEYLGHYFAATALEGHPVELQLISGGNSIARSFSYAPSARTEFRPKFFLCYPIESRTEAFRLAKYLAKTIPRQEVPLVTLEKAGMVWSVGLGMFPTDPPTPKELADLRETAKAISTAVFGGAKVEVWMFGEQGIVRRDSGP